MRQVMFFLVVCIMFGCENSTNRMLNGEWVSEGYGVIKFEAETFIMNDSIYGTYDIRDKNEIAFKDNTGFPVSYLIVKLTNDTLIIKGLLWTKESRLYVRSPQVAE